MNSEVLIIGGGVIGLSIARELHKRGIKGITILEQGRVGRESSYAAAGMLAPQAEADQDDDFFQLCLESNMLYRQFAEDLLEETGVDIELDRNGTLYLGFHEDDLIDIRDRFQWQTAAGLPIETMSATELRRNEPFISPNVIEGLFFPNDWQVENRKLLSALKKYAEFNEVKIIEKTNVANLVVRNGKIAGAESGDRAFSAERVILATGAWTSLIKTDEIISSSLRIKPIRGQMISFKTGKRLFTKVIYSPRGYLVPRRDGKILAGATTEDAGFDCRVTKSGVEFVRENALEIAPSLADLLIDKTWAGLRPMAESDQLPVLGEFPGVENLLIATAHYRNGILLTPITAKIMADKIAENINSKYLDIFSMFRFNRLDRSAAGVE